MKRNEQDLTLQYYEAHAEEFIGTGQMVYIEGSRKENGAHLYRIEMDVEAPEDLYFDFKLPA